MDSQTNNTMDRQEMSPRSQGENSDLKMNEDISGQFTPGEKAVSCNNTLNSISDTEHSSFVTLQQATTTFCNVQEPEQPLADSFVETNNYLSTLDHSQDTGNLLETYGTVEMDPSESASVNTGSNNEESAASSNTDNCTSDVLRDLTSDSVDSETTTGSSCEVDTETPSTSTDEERILQRNEVFLQQAKIDTSHEEHSVFRLKTIPKRSEITPIELPQTENHNIGDIEDVLQELGDDCTSGNDDNQSKSEEDLIGGVKSCSEDDSQNDDHFVQTMIDESESQISNQAQSYHKEEANGTKENSEISDIKEEGAVGGSEDENIQGILQKTASNYREKISSSVQFNDEVTVETFSQTEPSSSCTTKATLAHGDGPSPVASLRLSADTLLNESCFEPAVFSSTLQRVGSNTKHDRSRRQLQLFAPEPKKEEPLLRRTDSIPKVLSPTNLLHRKQKALAASRMNSTMPEIIPGNPPRPEKGNAVKPKKLNLQPEKLETSAVTKQLISIGRGALPSPSNPNKTMSESIKSKVETDRASSDLSLKDSKDIDKKSSDNSFILSGYDIAEYMIENAEVDLETTIDKSNKEHQIFPTLSELQQKILEESFQVYLTDSSASENTEQVSAKEDAYVVGTKNFDQSNTSSSKLHQKITERERGEINTPGLGAFSYTSPSKLHQRVYERETGEINTPGLGAFSYTSPSKLHQKVCERERGEINTPGLGALSYTSPSKLHQKINKRERADVKSPGLGAFSYTTPSELFKTRNKEDERAALTSKDTSPCHQAIETGNTEKEKVMDDQIGKIRITWDDISEGVDIPEGKELLKAELKEIEHIKEKANHWRKRCKRKERLDNLCRKTQEHSRSDISKQNVLSNESSCSCVISKYDLNTEIENEALASNNSDIQQMKENSVPYTNIVRLDSKTYHEHCQLYVGSILTNFLQYIKDKQIKNISLTDDDYRELKLIQALIGEVSKQNKEARTEDGQLIDDEENTGFLQLKDSVMLKKLQCQLEMARNVQNKACDRMANVDSEDDLKVQSIDLTRSGYLGETESSESNIGSFDHFMTPHLVYDKPYKTFSEDFGYSVGVDIFDSASKNEESFAGFSTESLKGTVSDTDSWLCMCDKCIQRKPSERQVLSRSTSLIEAELMHMLKPSGLIWQGSLEAGANKRDESKVSEEKNKIGELEKQTLHTLQIDKGEDKKERDGNKKISGSSESVEDNRAALTSKDTSPCNQGIETGSTEKEKVMDDQIGKISITWDDISEGVDNPEGKELLKAALKEIEHIKEKANHWRKRCERKERLDNLCRKTQEHSKSDISIQTVLSNESSCSCVISKDDLNTEIENEDIASNNSDMQQMKENSVPNTNIVRLDSKTYHEHCQLYVGSILTNFLQYIKDKQIKNISLTDDDYRELKLIQALIGEVSKQNKEARTEDGQLIDDEENTGFLQLKDSIMLKKLQCQLEMARNMQNKACDRMENVDGEDDLNVQSVDSIRNGYLGETESSESNIGSFDHFMTPHLVYDKPYKTFSEDFGYSVGVDIFDSASKNEESFAGFSTESLKGTVSDTDSWLCMCDKCIQRKPSERQVLSRSTSLIEAELMHMLKPSGLIWQGSLEAGANKRDESKVSEEKNKIGELEKQTLHTLQIDKGEDKKERDGNKKISGSSESVKVNRAALTSKDTSPCNQGIETGSTEKEKVMDDQIGKISITWDDISEGVDNPEGKELLKAELKEIEHIKEKAKHWRNRCKRKERLDNLCRKTQEHSKSDISIQTVLSNESSCSCVISKDDLNTEIENEDIASNNSDMQQMKENSVPNTNIVRLDSKTYHEHCQLYVGSILTNFLQYIKDKQIKNISLTDDDYRELKLIQALIGEVSKQNKEARTEDGQLIDDEENTGFLQLKDSVMLKKLQCQLEMARNMQNKACDRMANVDGEDDLKVQSVDSIRSGYLGETESSESNIGSFDHFMTPHLVYDKPYKTFSEDSGYSVGVDIFDSGTSKNEESFAGFSTESLKGTVSDTDSWLCMCDKCIQRKPSERQVLSRSTSLIDAELMHMLKPSGLIWQGSLEAGANKRDESKVSEEKNKIRELEKQTLHTLQIDKGEDKKERDVNEKISGLDGSIEVNIPPTESEQSHLECSPRLIKMLTCLEYPEDAGEVEFNIGPSYVSIDKEGWFSVASETDMNDESEQNLSPVEGSPDRGQRLFGSSQNLDRRDGGGGKRKQASRSMTPDSRYMLDKEVTESQNRKLQTEIATLQTENKLLKEKYNRAQAKISDLETQLADAQEDISKLQESLNQEVSDLSTRTKKEISRDRDSLEAKILALTKQNEALKLENSSLEKKLESSHRATDMARHNSEKSRTLEAHKSEITSLKEELNRVKALLEQSERHLREEEERHSVAGREIVKLTELKNALQQQSDSGGSAMYTDKQLKSLEKRLKVTEDRLHQERADRANNLSAVEDKLLTENAKLQASEKELSRQLHREKEKNRNFEQRVKQIREENEKLRLAMPFDDAALLSNKGNYDIPYSSHSNQRAETMKHISDDMNYILSQIEKQDGLQSRDDEEIIRTLWNKRELAYRQLQEYDVQFQELHINDHNITDGLKNLRDTYGQAESKLRSMEEQVEDSRAQVSTLDATYQEQLSVLVRERHEAFARLKTAEDLLEALRAENEVLHRTMSVSHTPGGPRQPGDHSGKSIEALHVEVTNLESKVSQLTRSNQLMEVELNTLRVQLVAREKALKDVQNELDLAYSRLKGDDSEDRKQEKIDQLSSQVSGLQVELQMMTDKYNHACTDNKSLESEISTLRKQAGSQRTKQLKSEHSETKALQQLKDDIVEKDCRLTSLSKQLDDLENQLQKTRQELYIEQMHSSELESENENLQQTVAQRAQMFEALSGSEREQLAQYQILKDTLDNVSQELAQKHAQIISLDVNLSGARDKCAELEEDVRRLRKGHGGEEEGQEAFTEDEQSSAHQLKIKELEKERAMLKQELEQAYSAIQASEEQYRTLQTESVQLEQELVKEKTVILQLTAEKGEVEQHLEELAEEHESLIQEKTQAEEDLIKLETKLQEILQKYENQARKQHGNPEQEYPGLPPEARELVTEIESLTLVLEGKEKEIAMLKDRMNRQNIEIDFLHHKVELVHNDSIANREDIARMISELTLKMKEAVSTREVNQFLVGERTKLQNEKSHLEKELDIERKNTDERKKEIQEVIRKIERTETSQKSTEKDSRNKDNLIISLETELRNAKQNLASMETEITQLRSKVDHLNEDLKNLTGINSSLERRLEMEQNSLSVEKSEVSKWKEEFNTLSHDFQVLEHEHSVLNDKYQAELHSNEKLKRELEVKEEENTTLKDDLSNAKVELDSNKGQLLITKDTVQKLTQDKGNIYQDYEGMCRSLTEKERQLTELRERTDEKIEHLNKEHTQERIRLEQDRAAAVQERDAARKEMDSINDQLRQKEIQLNAFGKTLQELESVTREKKQLEAHVHKLESSTGDSKVLLDGQRKELMALNEALAKQQERTTRLEAENHTLQADLKTQKESGNREAQELKIAINELKSQHENERHYLNDNLSQTQVRLRSVEASLSAAASDRDSLQAKARLLENTVEELHSKLSDETTGRRLAEQSVGTLRLQLEDMKNDKNVAEARFVEMKNQMTKAEEKLKREEEKCQGLSTQYQELNAISTTNRTNVKAKLEQIEMLQKEIANLKQMIETQKQTLNGKMKKSTLEYKQQIESIEEERDKLQMLNQQLSSDLDSCREHIASKNKENLKLQEEILVLEDSVRECKVKQKHAEDTLRVETDKQAELNARFEAQEEELKRLRNFLTKKVEQSGDSDKTMWHEMNRVIQELSRQMTSHLDSTRGGDKDKSPESLVSRLKKQLAEAQGELSTEKSLHHITKTSLQALEEDCQRLRKQLHHYRRRDPPSGEKWKDKPNAMLRRKHKNRMEAINAIIARSQSQAHALLASGGYFDESMASPRLRSHQTSPKVGFHSPRHAESPDNSYSEDLSIASLPAMHYGQPSKKS